MSNLFIRICRRAWTVWLSVAWAWLSNQHLTMLKYFDLLNLSRETKIIAIEFILIDPQIRDNIVCESLDLFQHIFFKYIN